MNAKTIRALRVFFNVGFLALFSYNAITGGLLIIFTGSFGGLVVGLLAGLSAGLACTSSPIGLVLLVGALFFEWKARKLRAATIRPPSPSEPGGPSGHKLELEEMSDEELEQLSGSWEKLRVQPSQALQRELGKRSQKRHSEGREEGRLRDLQV